MIRFDILTLFPAMLEGFINDSIIKRAIEKGLIEINLIDFRPFSTNKHLTVDDTAYGGGAGMLISVEPVVLALKSIDGWEKACKILTTPSGIVWNQKLAKEIKCENDHFIIICGHYEGIDERIIDYIDYEVSIGDYVLTGGEIAAVVIFDSLSRLEKGVLTDESIVEESFEDDLLEYPQYTRPFNFEGKEVPEILLSGHHKNIARWRRTKALEKTKKNRPDLFAKLTLSEEDLKEMNADEKNN